MIYLMWHVRERGIIPEQWLAYRIYSIKRYSVFYIFHDLSAALIRGRHLSKIQFIFCKQYSVTNEHLNFKKQNHVLVLV